MLNPNETKNGIEIDLLVREKSNEFSIWLPNVHFVDAQNVKTIAETIRLKQNGIVYWSRHLVLTLTQEYMDFHSYPMDTQTFIARFEPYSLPQTMLVFEPASIPITLYNDDGSYPFTHNAMWQFLSTQAYVVATDYGSSSPRIFSVGHAEFAMRRRSSGLIFRLAVPIVFILILAGLIFWANPKDRVSSTITLLLAISALYIGKFYCTSTLLRGVYYCR